MKSWMNGELSSVPGLSDRGVVVSSEEMESLGGLG